MVCYTTQTNATDQSSIVVGNVALISGNYSATPMTSAAPISTGGVATLAAGATLGTSNLSTTAAPPKIAYNGASGLVTLTPGNLSDTGSWWAIIQVA